MNKIRWSPLPIDSQVVAALEDKKDQFVNKFKQTDTIDMWYFKHVCTVLDHAKKLFETDIDSIVSDSFQQEKHDDAT